MVQEGRFQKERMCERMHREQCPRGFPASACELGRKCHGLEYSHSMGQRYSGFIMSLFWGSSAFTGLASSYFSGYILGFMSVHQVFLITAVGPVAAALAGLFASESGSQEVQTIRHQAHLLWTAFTRTTDLQGRPVWPIWKPALYLFIWMATPSSDTTMFYYFTNALHFTEEQMGRISFVTACASAIATVSYNAPGACVRKIPLRGMCVLTSTAVAATGMLLLVLVLGINHRLGISDIWFTLGDQAVATGMSAFSFYPLMILAVRLCPPGIEGSMFALLMSSLNCGGIVSTSLGGLFSWILGITQNQFDKLWIFVTVCSLVKILPLFLLPLLVPPETASLPADEEEAADFFHKTI